jgi:glycosyltransferase involved in cell wall biosynthesis
MYVGNAYPHKNFEALVLAYREIKNKNLQLVLIGKEDYFYQSLKSLVKKEKIDNIIFAGFVPDEELDVIYKNALFYIFPSLYEGFGLPPLEAMMREIPVASSDIPCMKEILGENVFYFNANKKENISEAINDFSENKELRTELAKRGLQWTKKYSWKEMAEKTLEEYKSINS